MLDLDRALRRYVEDTVERTDIADLNLAPRRVRRRDWAQWLRRPVVAAALGALAVVVTIGGVALLLRGGDTTPATTVVATTVTEPTLTTTPASSVPPDTTSPTPTTAPTPIDSGPISWSRYTLPGEGVVNAIIEGGPGVMAAGMLDRSAAIWLSPDGVTWEPVSLASTISDDDGVTEVSALVAGPDGYVAVGGSGVVLGSGSRRAAIWRSADGLVWERVPLGPELTVQGWTGLGNIVHGVAGYVATGTFADTETPFELAGFYVLRSADGLDWERADLSDLPIGAMWDVIATADGYLGVGVSWVQDRVSIPGVWSSVDGVTWSVLDGSSIDDSPGGTAIQYMTALAVADDGTFIAAGEDLEQPLMWRSGDGVNWPLDPPLDYPDGLFTIIESIDITGDRGVAVGGGATGPSPQLVLAWTTSDGGQTWELATGPEAVFGPAPGSASMADLTDFGGVLIGAGAWDGAPTIWVGEWNEEDGK